MNHFERSSSMNGESQANIDRQTFDDVPKFDPEAAARRVQEARERISNKTDAQDEIKNEGEIEDESPEDAVDYYDSYAAPMSVGDIEKSKTKLPNYEKILSSPNTLKAINKNYLEQYRPNSETRADRLFRKDALDHYVLGQLSGDNARDFARSEQFKNYSAYIVSAARQKELIIDGKTYYPELATNPVLKDSEYRKLVISNVYGAKNADRINANLGKNEAGYLKHLKTIEDELENHKNVSQGELNMVGDYLYCSRDFNNGVAKKFACYLFNDAKQRQDLHLSTQIGGALANYFAHYDTLDDRLKDKRVFVAKYLRARGGELERVSTGVSTANYTVLEQNKINGMSISSEEGLSKSRPETITDLYSLMLVSYHELTHDYQRFMACDGKENSAAMSNVLNGVLRRNKSECFPVVDKNLEKVLDANGDERKTGYYNANHDSDEMEIQADEEGWRQCRKFIHEHEVQYYWNSSDKDSQKRASEHWSKCQDNEQEVRARRAFALKVDEKGREMPYIQYDIKQLGESIKDKSDYLQEFPQLAEFFNDAGNIKPEIFFQKQLASVEHDGVDTATDDFGVEIATYALMDDSSVKNIISYIEGSNNSLNSGEAMRCLANLYNVLHQDVLKTRPLNGINFDNYSQTKTRGKYTSVGDLKKSYLKQYMQQLYNATHIAEVLRRRYPDLDEKIEHYENDYFITYYNELSQGVSLDASFSKNAKNNYLRTRNAALLKIANKL